MTETPREQVTCAQAAAALRIAIDLALDDRQDQAFMEGDRETVDTYLREILRALYRVSVKGKREALSGRIVEGETP